MGSIYPLLNAGYDELECPLCGKMCYPDAKGSDGTIIYNLHLCHLPDSWNMKNKRFEINLEGEYYFKVPWKKRENLIYKLIKTVKSWTK